MNKRRRTYSFCNEIEVEIGKHSDTVNDISYELSADGINTFYTASDDKSVKKYSILDDKVKLVKVYG